MVRTIIFILALFAIVYNSVETGRSFERCDRLVERIHQHAENLKNLQEMKMEDDLFNLSKKEYCKKYDITAEEYEMIQKDFQEM